MFKMKIEPYRPPQGDENYFSAISASSTAVIEPYRPPQGDENDRCRGSVTMYEIEPYRPPQGDENPRGRDVAIFYIN